jgi:predicted MFS family arabinose efflux permease
MSKVNTRQQPAGAAGPAPARADAGPRGAGRREWQILAVVLAGSFMAVLDTTIVNVALPSIGRGIQASPSALEWVVSGYALAFGLGLVPLGRLGDRFGYKPQFLTGLTIFTTLANLGFIAVALVCARMLPRRLGDDRDEANR